MGVGSGRGRGGSVPSEPRALPLLPPSHALPDRTRQIWRRGPWPALEPCHPPLPQLGLSPTPRGTTGAHRCKRRCKMQRGLTLSCGEPVPPAPREPAMGAGPSPSTAPRSPWPPRAPSTAAPVAKWRLWPSPRRSPRGRHRLFDVPTQQKQGLVLRMGLRDSPLPLGTLSFPTARSLPRPGAWWPWAEGCS